MCVCVQTVSHAMGFHQIFASINYSSHRELAERERERERINELSFKGNQYEKRFSLHITVSFYFAGKFSLRIMILPFGHLYFDFKYFVIVIDLMASAYRPLRKHTRTHTHIH